MLLLYVKLVVSLAESLGSGRLTSVEFLSILVYCLIVSYGFSWSNTIKTCVHVKPVLKDYVRVAHFEELCD